MTKSELITRLGAHHSALTGRDAQDAVNAIVRALAQALHDGHRIEIRDFGVFITVMRRAHVARNPKSGEAVNVADKYVPTFKAGKELRERVARSKMIEDELRVAAEPPLAA